jgi:integrase
VAQERLSATWLSLYGLRRGEVLGLCWSDIDLQAKMITIQRARFEVTGSGVVEVGPKTERGERTLPMDDVLAAALRSLKARQAQERLEARERTSPVVVTAQGLTSWWTNWAIHTGRSGTPTSSGIWPKRPGCRPSGSMTLGTPAAL